MKLKKFLKILRKYYSKVIPGTNIRCKFWAQPTSFSYALFTESDDSMFMSFTKSNEVYASEVFYDWGRKCDSEDRDEIIKNIIMTANRIYNE